MKKIEIFYNKIKKDDTLREDFVAALANGSLLDFFISLGYDFRLSDLSKLFDMLQERDKSLFEDISIELEEDPVVDIPPEVLDDMVSPFQEDFVPPPEFLINYNAKFKPPLPPNYTKSIIAGFTNGERKG